MSKLFRRLGRMSAREISWRARAAARNGRDRVRARLVTPRWDRAAILDVLAVTPEAEPMREAVRRQDWAQLDARLAACIARGPARFLIAPTLRTEVTDAVHAAFPAAAADAAARAERLLQGEFDLLGYRGLRFETALGAPDWHFDPVNRRRAPMRFWSEVPFLVPACGDHKVIWELNRQQHLLAFGRAYWLTGEARYRRAAIEHTRRWMQHNPPLMGINWASMLELGFRAISWTWMLHFCADPEATDEPWIADTVVALDRQLAHIEQNLSHYFSPNTHLLGEALALYVAGLAFPWLRRAERYAAVGRQVLVEQAGRQIAPDGGHVERSAHYHRYTLDFYLLALAIARINGDAAAAPFEDAVSRLGAAALLLADDRGRLPHVGDDDGGMLLPMCGRAVDDARDSLATAAGLTRRTDLRVSAPAEETVWMLAHPVLREALAWARAAAPSAAPVSGALPDTGYFVSRSASGTHLVIDAGPHGFANGGHAHADALSLTLTVRDLPLIIDPGTATYTADSALRDRFRSTALHNTVTIDRLPQSVPAGPFHWTRAAEGRAHRWRTNAAFDYLEATHDGYAPLVHRRHVLSVHGDLIIVADAVEGSGTHDVRVHWHLDPRWHVEVEGRHARLRAPGERAELVVSGGELEAFTGDEAEALGWHAPVYGRVEPCSTLRASVHAPAPTWIVSVINLNATNEILAVEPMPVWAEAGALVRSTAVRISRRASVDLFGIGEPAGGDGGPPARWRLGPFETDARAILCRTRDRVARVAMVDGTMLRGTGRHPLDLVLPAVASDLHLDLTEADAGVPLVRATAGQALPRVVVVRGRTCDVAPERRAVIRPASSRLREAAASGGPDVSWMDSRTCAE